MQKVVLKRSVPFRTMSGTILTDTIIVSNDTACQDDVLNIIALVEGQNTIIRHSSNCVFNKNKIMHTETFSEHEISAKEQK